MMKDRYQINKTALNRFEVVDVPPYTVLSQHKTAAEAEAARDRYRACDNRRQPTMPPTPPPERKSITVAELLAALQPLKDISPDLELKVWLPGTTITLAKNVFVRGGDSFLSIEGNVDEGSALYMG